MSLKKRCIPRSEKTVSPASEPQTASHSILFLFLNKADAVPRLPCLSLIYCIVLLRSRCECDWAETVCNFKVKVIPIWCTSWGADWSVKSMWQVVPGEVGRRDTQTRPGRQRQTKSGPKWQSDAPPQRVKAPFERESFWLDNDLFIYLFFQLGNVKPNPHSSRRKGSRIVVMLQLGEQKVAGGRNVCMQSVGRGTRRHMHTNRHPQNAASCPHRKPQMSQPVPRWSLQMVFSKRRAANIPCITKVILSRLFLLLSTWYLANFWGRNPRFLPRYWTFALIFWIINSSAGPQPNIYAQQK